VAAVVVVGAGAAAAWAITAEKAPAPKYNRSAAINFRDRMFIEVEG
jgi:hypothetical protein